jgi:ubiquinone/menaquinone biosynthesis C-methylase UbiE
MTETPKGKLESLSNFDRFQRIAWAYDLLDLPFEYGRYRKIRPMLFRGLSGRILEAGVGTGRNFPFYPPDCEVVGIDLSPAMLARAERRRLRAATKVDLRQMDVTRLSFPDRSFDAAVATFLFCTLPDELQVSGMRELGRVVKPGGIILYYSLTRGSQRRDHYQQSTSGNDAMTIGCGHTFFLFTAVNCLVVQKWSTTMKE